MSLKWSSVTDQLYAVSNSSPSLDLDFAANKTLDDNVSGNNLVTFSRASSGTYVGSDGLIKTAVVDEPRFDHDPVTLQSLGLLVEESRINYATQSANPSGWSTTNGATKETFAAVTAPDGSTITQGFRIPDVGSRVYPTLSSPGTVETVGSVYARAVSGTATLSLFIQGVAVQTNVTVPSDSWVRLNGTKASATTTAFSVRGNGSQPEDVYLWGAQLEANASFPTSYIPTSGSALPRAADLASITGTNFSSWFNYPESTLYSEGVFIGDPYNGDYGYLATLDIGINDGSFYFRDKVEDSSDTITFQSTLSGVGTTTGNIIVSIGANAKNTPLKYIHAIDVGVNAGSAVNGNVISTTNVLSGIQIPDRLQIGRHGAAYKTTCTISRLAYYPYRLADTTLQEITS